jgi:hypothetical protein
MRLAQTFWQPRHALDSAYPHTNQIPVGAIRFGRNVGTFDERDRSDWATEASLAEPPKVAPSKLRMRIKARERTEKPSHQLRVNVGWACPPPAPVRPAIAPVGELLRRPERRAYRIFELPKF